MAPKLKFNPWSTEAPVKAQAEGVEAAAPKRKLDAIEELGAGAPPTTNVEVKSYGGFTVKDAENPTEAVLAVLEWCIKNERASEAVLAQYGVAVAHFPKVPEKGFYVRRGWDGWALVIPEAQTRDQGVMQLTQALLELSRTATLGASMTAAGITPYRL